MVGRVEEQKEVRVHELPAHEVAAVVERPGLGVGVLAGVQMFWEVMMSTGHLPLLQGWGREHRRRRPRLVHCT